MYLLHRLGEGRQKHGQYSFPGNARLTQCQDAHVSLCPPTPQLLCPPCVPPHPNCQQKSISAMDPPLLHFLGVILFSHISGYIYFIFVNICAVGAKYVGVRV